MRILLALVPLAFGCFVGTACESTGSDADVPLEASPDQYAPGCMTDKDCSGGLTCVYPILVGCSAQGECRDLTDAGNCTVATTACACDGKTIDIPPCWQSFAPVPVLSSGGSCVDR